MDLKGIYHFHRIDKKSRKRDSGQIFIKISLLFQLAFFLIANTACVPSGENSGGRKSKSNAATTNTPANTGTPSAPNFSSSNNFFQNGSVTSLTSFTIDSTFADSFYLRGAEINNYLANGNTEATCLVFNFPNVNAQSRTLVLTGSPQNFINFATKLKENYYLVEPTNKGLNQTFCQNPGIINYIGLKYPTSTIVYNLAELCPNCTTFLLDSGPLELVTKAGQLIAEIKTNYLDLRVKTQGTLLNDDSGQGCLSSSECVLKGFDCCSGGQCVKDLSLKSGTNTSSTDFLQASNDIALNPSNIYNYPNFYHICAKVVVPTPTPVPTVNPDDASNQRLSMLKELYECSSLVLGEMSVCSKTYYEASKNTGPYKTGKDDRNFLTTYSGNKTMSPNSITEIYHAGELIYKNGSGLTSGISVGQGNDNLSDVTNVTLTRAKPVSAKNDDLKIKYMIDGSCTFINSALAKCSKYYVQGQNLGKIDDHYPASNKFALPLYIDTTRIINVEVDGTNKVGETDWDLVIASPSYVQFKGPGGSTSLQVFDTQKIKINFFVDMAQNNVLQSKLEALNSIDSLCNCGGPYCSLKEVMINTNGIDKVADYACVYPDNSAAPPLQQTIYLSSKTIPHRYFDKEGVHQTNIDLNTPEQEGTKFSYTGKNLLRPNNLTQYVGFNEIYGSMSSDPTGAKPAKEVVVKSGKTYDIFIDYGTFSTCPSCGNDYFSTLAKVFPTNFTNKGGGYRPEKTITNRQKSQTYRGDDLLFGRACFIPATMIPWSHNKNPDRANQRLGRLAAQHFFFANGYQRDWFGFDYGSIIGSFDGVTWFAVGNQR